MKSRVHWIARLRRGSKSHLIPSNEWGEPVCGKTHDPADRIKTTKASVSIPELVAAQTMCQACLNRFSAGYAQLHDLYRSGGKTDEQATALADEVFGLKRENSK